MLNSPAVVLAPTFFFNWPAQPNREKASINWLFDVDKPRAKPHRAYDNLTGQN